MHPDTVESMLGVADALVGGGKMYPQTATGSAEARNVRKSIATTLTGVSLKDQLTSTMTASIPIPGSAVALAAQRTGSSQV
jgi:uncharacterized protein (DUF697 family)